jgi:hexosaminidase
MPPQRAKLSNPLIAIRGVHLDLKGLPPTPARLLKLLDLFAAAKLNCVLVEWEDAFAWEFDRRLRSPTAYTPQLIDDFHSRARELGLHVIPLAQTLGHMETTLRFDDRRALREIPDRCDAINPLAPGAHDLVERMIDDVLRRSMPITHFHLGGDEHWTFGTHPDTRAYIESHDKAALYLQFVEPLLDKLLAKGIRPILWHDMMHDWDAASLARLSRKADLMFWAYQGHPDSAGPAHNTKVLERFSQAGVKLWGACAYKGADSRGDAELPDRPARVANAVAWADVARRFDLQGVVATAWSRYATSRVQCEPIDGALDVLIRVADVLHDGEPPADDDVTELLKSLGEWERFNACRNALSRLSEAKRTAWQCIVQAYQQASLERHDPTRRGSGVFQEMLRIAREQTTAAQKAADHVRKALSGLVESVWIEEFITERLAALLSAIDVCVKE